MSQSLNVRQLRANARARSLVGFLSLCMVIAAGWRSGKHISFGAGSWPVGVAALGSVVLMTIAFMIYRRRTILVLIAYTLFFLFYFDPFSAVFIHREIMYWQDLSVIILFLLPLIIGCVSYSGRGCWVAYIGVALLIYAAVAAVSYNVDHGASGVGFFVSWAE
jgi:hypothetical protein